MGNFCFKLFDSKEHTNSSKLCNVLKKQRFELSHGPKLEEKLINIEGSKTFEKIENKLNILLGGGRNEVLTIPAIVDKLFTRNYPEFKDFDGVGKLVIFVPEWYLAKMGTINFVDPSRGRQLHNYSE